MLTVLDTMRNGKQYDGASEKFGITLNGADYIVKFSSKGLTTQLYSEHVGSRFIRLLGVPCHKTLLGTYNNRMCVLLEDFTSPMIRLRTFHHAMQSSGGYEPGYVVYTLDNILSLIEQSTHMSGVERAAIRQQFCNVVICDALLGNTDRHWGNWGYLVENGHYKPAPIYDNELSLYADLGMKILDYKRDPYAFLESCTCRRPSSAIRDDKGKRVLYGNLLNDSRIQTELLNRLSLESVRSAITEAVREVPPMFQEFYIQYVVLRYLRLFEKLDYKEAIKHAVVATKN